MDLDTAHPAEVSGMHDPDHANITHQSLTLLGQFFGLSDLSIEERTI
jgi:hypothetical protein